MDDFAEREREVMELLSAVWDERIDKSTHQRLENLLSLDDFAGVNVLAEFTQMHMDLEWLVSSNAAQRRARDAILRARRASTGPQRKYLPTKPLLGLAAGILLVLIGAWYFAPWVSNSRDLDGDRGVAGRSMIRPPMPVGRLVGQAGRWREGYQLRDGQILSEGQVIDLVAGTARISMDFGAEVVLQSPCRVTVISGDLVAVESGKIAVRAADWAVGFKVRTNDLLVTDIGTEFMVNANAPTGSEVHVSDGLVIVSPLRQSTSYRRVTAGQAVRINDQGTLDAVAFRQERFVDELDRLRPLHSIKLASTGVGLQVGEKDPHWLITAGDSHFGPYPQQATVCAANAIYGSNDPASSQWISVMDGTSSGVPVRSKYSFETTFDLTGLDVNSVRLTGLVLADNGIEEVRLNGRRLPIAPWSDWFAGVTFFGFHSIEITSGFVPGKNVLSFVVINETDIPPPEEEGGGPIDTPNPMGLRVEWRGSGRLR